MSDPLLPVPAEGEAAKKITEINSLYAEAKTKIKEIKNPALKALGVAVLVAIAAFAATAVKRKKLENSKNE